MTIKHFFISFIIVVTVLFFNIKPTIADEFTLTAKENGGVTIITIQVIRSIKL